MTRYLTTSAGTSGVIPYTGRVAGLWRLVLREQGLFSELLPRKDGGTMMGRIMDKGTCKDMEIRVRTGGGQPWKQGCGNAVALQDWVLYAKEADLEYRYV